MAPDRSDTARFEQRLTRCRRWRRCATASTVPGVASTGWSSPVHRCGSSASPRRAPPWHEPSRRANPCTRSSLVERLLDGGAIHPRPSESGPATFTIDDVTVITPQLGGIVVDDGRLVVDDGSAPALVGAAVRHADNRGPAAARNSGRQLVGTSLVAFVDADVTLTGDWLERTPRTLRRPARRAGRAAGDRRGADRPSTSARSRPASAPAAG